MKRCLAMLGVLLGLVVVGLGADWPQWRGLNRDGHSPETGLLKTWGENGPKRLWVADGLGDGYSSVTVVDSRIYAMGLPRGSKEGFVSVFDLDGNLQQRIAYGEEWSKSYYGSKGVVGLVRAGPDGGELVGTVKIDRGNGAHWTHPVIVGGRLYIRHGDALLVFAIVR